MNNHMVETRVMSLVDIPLLRRMADTGVVLDSAMHFTRDVESSRATLMSSVLLPQRNMYTLIARSDARQVVGQLRMRQDEHNAQIMLIAPGLSADVEDTEWLHLLDAMATEAGKRGAQTLMAEVDESSVMFELLRTAGFAVYSRQEIWQRLPDQVINAQPVELQTPTDADEMSIQSLYCHIVPGIMQQVSELPSSPMNGWVYRINGRIEAYVSMSEGRHGIYIVPYVHPDIYREMPGVLAAVIDQANRADRLPVYVRVRRYQSWLEEPLFKLGLTPIAQQAVMVRHLTASIRQPAFVQPFLKTLEALPKPVLPKQPLPTPITEPTLKPIDTSHGNKPTPTQQE